VSPEASVKHPPPTLRPEHPFDEYGILVTPRQVADIHQVGYRYD
jgi:hypothetical protein